MSIINRNHVATATSIKVIRWSTEKRAFIFSARQNGAFVDLPVTKPLALDVWLTKLGWQWWGADKLRNVDLVSADQPSPPKPDVKASEIYSIPAFSTEVGGRVDMIIKGKGETEALADFFDDINHVLLAAQATKEFVVPIVTIGDAETVDMIVAPVFTASDWNTRPEKWTPPIVTFR